MAELDLYNIYQLLRRNIFIIISIFVILNIYPTYLYVNYNNISDERISKTEIVPVNEINLITLRDFQTKIINAKVLIESGYNDLKISKMQNNEFFVYTPQNLLSLFFDTAVSKETVKSFIKSNNLEGIISESNFSVQYQTSNRIDPFNDVPQKIVTISLRIPNMNYTNLLFKFVEHINKLAIVKINEQLDISTNNLSNILQTFRDILETKKNDLMQENKIDLQNTISVLSERLKQTNNEIASLNEELKSNLNEKDLENYIEVLIKYPSLEVLTDNDMLNKVNDEIKMWIREFRVVYESELENLDKSSQKDLFNKFFLNKVLLKKDVENVIFIQKLFFLVSSYNNLSYEKILAEKELVVLNQRIKDKSNYGIISEFDQNYLTQSTLMQQSLLKEKSTLSKSIEIVNTSYTDVQFHKISINLWYFVVSNFLAIVILSVYLILVFEFQNRRN